MTATRVSDPYPFNADPDSDPAFNINADPDPAFHLDTDPASKNNADPCGRPDPKPWHQLGTKWLNPATYEM
jgi:hypothetical protein